MGMLFSLCSEARFSYTTDKLLYLFVTAPGQFDWCEVVVVYPRCSGLKLLDDAVRPIEVLGEDT
jgi:hypothetical protein